MTNPVPAISWEQEVRNSSEQLRYLSIAAYVYAAFNAIGILFLVGVLVFGSGAVLIGDVGSSGEKEAVQVLASGVMVIIAILAVAVSVLQFLFARWLQVHTNYMGVIIMAALTCLSVPIGTALGVWTLVVVTRPSAKALFQRTA